LVPDCEPAVGIALIENAVPVEEPDGGEKMQLLNAPAKVKPRKLKGRPLRSQSIGTKLTEQEETAVLAAAQSEGKSPGEWVRDTLMAAARNHLSSEDFVLFIELQAIRLLLINTLEPLLRGDKMTAEQFKEMLRYVKANKRKAAEDTLTGYTERSTEQL
jgi:hypothetical protein